MKVDHWPDHDTQLVQYIISGCLAHISKAARHRSPTHERSVHAITAGVERAVLHAATSRLIRSRMSCAGSDGSSTGNLGHARVIPNFRKAKDTLLDT